MQNRCCEITYSKINQDRIRRHATSALGDGTGDGYLRFGQTITINHTVDYMAQGFMSFMRGVDITRAIGRVGLKVQPVLGPEIALAVARAIWAQNR